MLQLINSVNQEKYLIGLSIFLSCIYTCYKKKIFIAVSLTSKKPINYNPTCNSYARLPSVTIEDRNTWSRVHEINLRQA
jgi:hypothetical protein